MVHKGCPGGVGRAARRPWPLPAVVPSPCRRVARVVATARRRAVVVPSSRARRGHCPPAASPSLPSCAPSRQLRHKAFGLGATCGSSNAESVASCAPLEPDVEVHQHSPISEPQTFAFCCADGRWGDRGAAAPLYDAAARLAGCAIQPLCALSTVSRGELRKETLQH